MVFVDLFFVFIVYFHYGGCTNNIYILNLFSLYIFLQFSFILLGFINIIIIYRFSFISGLQIILLYKELPSTDYLRFSSHIYY